MNGGSHALPTPPQKKIQRNRLKKLNKYDKKEGMEERQ